MSDSVKITRGLKGVCFEHAGVSAPWRRNRPVRVPARRISMPCGPMRLGLNANVGFHSGVIHRLHGVPIDLPVPILAIGRMPGWVTQCLAQRRAPPLIRPLTLYDGPEARDLAPLADRRAVLHMCRGAAYAKGGGGSPPLSALRSILRQDGWG